EIARAAGPAGRVIGVECRSELLELARGEQAARSGHVEFRRGLPFDLRLDLELLDAELARRPIGSASDWVELRAREERLRSEQPLIADASIDCVVSVDTFNHLQPREQQQFFQEVFRVLRVGGRALVSDLVSDEELPDAIRQDPEFREWRAAG